MSNELNNHNLARIVPEHYKESKSKSSLHGKLCMYDNAGLKTHRTSSNTLILQKKQNIIDLGYIMYDVTALSNPICSWFRWEVWKGNERQVPDYCR